MAGTPLYHIYCDESRQVEDRYMVFGGIVVSDNSYSLVESAILKTREKTGLYGELKWTKVSNQRYEGYQEFIDTFFHLARQGHLAFKSVIFDTANIDYQTNQSHEKEVGFYRLWYQFLINSFREYCPSCDCRWRILLDERSSNQSLSDFQLMLNHGLQQKYGVGTNVIRAVEPVVSHRAPILQLADIIMGAIGFVMNDYHLHPEARQAKVLLSQYIAQQAGLVSLKQQPPMGMRYFAIWHFKFNSEGDEN